jgi:hypothetical protein
MKLISIFFLSTRIRDIHRRGLSGNLCRGRINIIMMVIRKVSTDIIVYLLVFTKMLFLVKFRKSAAGGLLYSHSKNFQESAFRVLARQGLQTCRYHRHDWKDHSQTVVETSSQRHENSPIVYPQPLLCHLLWNSNGSKVGWKWQVDQVRS